MNRRTDSSSWKILSTSNESSGRGIPIEMELAHVYTLRDGRVARCVEYFDRAEALDAVGLRE